MYNTTGGNVARTKQQQGKYVRTKGLNFERNVANKLKEIFPNAKRHLETQASEAIKGIDLDGTEPYGIQCKAYKTYAPINKIFEVKQGIPILITKGNNLKPMVVMSLDTWIKSLKGEIPIPTEDECISK